MKQSIDLSYIVKKVGGNTIIYVPTDNVYYHTNVMMEEYPELLKNDSVYIVHVNSYVFFRIYRVKFDLTTPFPICMLLESDEIPDDLKPHMSEVLSSGYMYHVHNALGADVALNDDIQLVSNIIDGYCISENAINEIMIDGVPHIILFNDIHEDPDDWFESDIHRQVDHYIHKGYDTINLINLYVSDDEYYQRDTLIKVTGDGHECTSNRNPSIDIKAISTEYGVYIKMRQNGEA